MKLSSVLALFAVASPLVSGLKGARSKKETTRRVLKGGDDSGGLPDLDGLLEAACFSEVSTVQVSGTGSVAMKDLQVGDKVWTGSNYQPVYAFAHLEKDQVAEFVQISTHGNTLEMTGQHLVFVEGKSAPVRADSVNVGDLLQGVSAQVTKIGTVTREGLYAPLTQEGKLVVDGIVASSYISLQETEYVQVQGVSTGLSQQTFLHWMASPFRLMCLGISSSIGQSYNEQGIPHFVAKGLSLKEWAETQNILVQVLLLSVVLVLAGACMILENTLGASTAPLLVGIFGAAFAVMKAKGITIQAKKFKTV